MKVEYRKDRGEWYVVVCGDDGRVLVDSQKVTFPFDPDGLTEEELIDSIRSEWPDAEIDGHDDADGDEVVNRYRFATDAESGWYEAKSFRDAVEELADLIASCDCGSAWIEDPEGIRATIEWTPDGARVDYRGDY